MTCNIYITMLSTKNCSVLYQIEFMFIIKSALTVACINVFIDIVILFGHTCKFLLQKEKLMPTYTMLTQSTSYLETIIVIISVTISQCHIKTFQCVVSEISIPSMEEDCIVFSSRY